MARLVDCSARLPRAWAEGLVSIPQEVADWLEATVAHRLKHPDPPLPRRWRRQPPPPSF